jgi:hypothetical protein
MLFLLLVLILLFGLGGHYYNEGAYRGPGIGIGTILLIVLLYLLLSGSGPWHHVR